MAEGAGFEPAVRYNPYDGLANRWIKPLSHPSGFSKKLDHKYTVFKPKIKITYNWE